MKVFYALTATVALTILAPVLSVSPALASGSHYTRTNGLQMTVTPAMMHAIEIIASEERKMHRHHR